MDDIDEKHMKENLDEDSGEPIEEQPRRVPAQITVGDAMDTLELFKLKLVDQHYEQMLEDGEADVKVPLEVLDSIEVLLYFVNASFNMDEEI